MKYIETYNEDFESNRSNNDIFSVLGVNGHGGLENLGEGAITEYALIKDVHLTSPVPVPTMRVRYWDLHFTADLVWVGRTVAYFTFLKA